MAKEIPVPELKIVLDPAEVPTNLLFLIGAELDGKEVDLSEYTPTSPDTVLADSIDEGSKVDQRLLVKAPDAGGTYTVALTVEGLTAEEQLIVQDSALNSMAGSLQRLEDHVSEGTTKVSLRADRKDTDDAALWEVIRCATDGISFTSFSAFVDAIFCPSGTGKAPNHLKPDKRLFDKRFKGSVPHGARTYELLKVAAEAFLLVNCGTLTEMAAKDCPPRDEDLDIETTMAQYLSDSGRLPYIENVIKIASETKVANKASEVLCDGVLDGFVDSPCFLELIWSYWHEQGALVQSIGAISMRFQNKGAFGARAALSNLALDPLRPLSNLFWGYIQDEPSRLSVRRRTYEYEHAYGLGLVGKVVGNIKPAERRSKFLEGFHTLLQRASVYYTEAADKTIEADAFPLLNALKEVHLILAEGMHNQYRDLPWVSRVEMLTQQWLMARQETKAFLRGRAMVPYREEWMPQVETMKGFLRWPDVSIAHFHDLARFGEQILLSIRFGNWSAVQDESAVRNWADFWRPEIQGYIHAYRATTGVDLWNAEKIDATSPASLLAKRVPRKSA